MWRPVISTFNVECLLPDTTKFHTLKTGFERRERLNLNKKVLLHEHWRHTDRGVSSTPSVILYEVGPPRQGTPQARSNGRYPPAGVPPNQVWQRGYLRWGTPIGVPPWPCLMGRYLRWGTPQQGYPPPAGPGWVPLPCLDLAGVPPPPWCGQTDGWMDGWMDRHMWKHYLPVILRTRSVKINHTNT